MEVENITLTRSILDCLNDGCYVGVVQELYFRVRLPLSAFICAIGCFFNVCNIIIFSRPKMRTPVNIFLASMSTAQFLFSLNYLILILLEYFRNLCYPLFWTYAFTVYKLVNVNVSVVLHLIVLSHIMTVVAFRIRSMQPPIQLNQFLYGTDWAMNTSGMVWLFTPMFCIPVYFTSTMYSVHNNPCQFEAQVYDHSNVDDQLLIITIYWVYGVVLKLLPALFAIFLFCALLKLPLSSEEFRRRMRESQENKQRKVSSTSSRKEHCDFGNK
ncbi:Thyrotropin-releasing hormone receptor [Aphelenchoides bicaudatus]|nr:Thyrotropin-releasing hormone receptor [Aphelenchoides bicaudatus]